MYGLWTKLARRPEVSEVARCQRFLGIGEQRLQGTVDEAVNVIIGCARLESGCHEGLVPPRCPLQKGEFECVQGAGSLATLIGLSRIHSPDFA